VRRNAIRVAVLWLAATVALALALDRGPHERGLALAAYLDFVCMLALAGVAATIASVLPAARVLHRAPRRPRTAPMPPRPEPLATLERELGGSEHEGFELPARFIALVRQIAAAALARRHGVVLEREPGRARELLGERVWNVIRDDPPPPERLVSGLPLAEFGVIVDDLEAV
jgi:hypothetical protein